MVRQRLVDEHRHARRNEGPRTRDVLAADGRYDKDGVDLAEQVPVIGDDVGDGCALRDVLGGAPAVARAPDVGDPRHRDTERGGWLLVQVGRDAREGKLACYPLSIIAVEDGRPEVGMAIAQGGA